jgi:hypothetical protein
MLWPFEKGKILPGTERGSSIVGTQPVLYID